MKIAKLVAASCACLLLARGAWAREPLWKIDLGSEIAGAPAAYAARALVATRGGLLVAVEGDGRIAWKQKLPGGCLAAPAIDRDGSIYVACADGTLLRFSAAGRELWRASLGQELLSTPLPGERSIFQVGGAGRVWKVRKQDGRIEKQVELGIPVHASPVWDGARIHFLVPAKDYFLLALDQELGVRWRFRTAGVNFASPAVTPAGEIYCSSMGRTLHKLANDGRPLWNYRTQGWIKASPVVDDEGRVYVGCYDRQVHAVDADGRGRWKFPGKAQFTAGAALDDAGRLYCGDFSGTVYALDRSGRTLWEYKSPDFITGDLTILPGRVLLAGSIDGTLLAFRVERSLSRRAWWAKSLGNLMNSGFDEN
jgi:outer membrane protein assembly factor BamB